MYKGWKLNVEGRWQRERERIMVRVGTPAESSNGHVLLPEVTAMHHF